MTHRTSHPDLPSVPVDLVAVAIGGCQVLLAWTECEAGALEFRVERADGTGSACQFSEIGRTGAHVAAFRDGAVHPRTAYSYRVHAWNGSRRIVALQCGAGDDVAGRDGTVGG